MTVGTTTWVVGRTDASTRATPCTEMQTTPNDAHLCSQRNDVPTDLVNGAERQHVHQAGSQSLGSAAERLCRRLCGGFLLLAKLFAGRGDLRAERRTQCDGGKTRHHHHHAGRTGLHRATFGWPRTHLLGRHHNGHSFQRVEVNGEGQTNAHVSVSLVTVERRNEAVAPLFEEHCELTHPGQRHFLQPDDGTPAAHNA